MCSIPFSNFFISSDTKRVVGVIDAKIILRISDSRIIERNWGQRKERRLFYVGVPSEGRPIHLDISRFELATRGFHATNGKVDGMPEGSPVLVPAGALSDEVDPTADWVDRLDPAWAEFVSGVAAHLD